jgi:Glycoside hydrolase family 44/Bacterial Ig-like domain (group 2)
MGTQATYFRATVAALAILAAGCADQRSLTSAEPQLAVATLRTTTIAPATATVAAGATVQLIATARDRRGRVIAGATFVWASANPAIATVSSTGLMTAVAAGNVAITANRSGAVGTARVTVTGAAPPPPPPATGDVTFLIDGSSTFPISRFIYGANVVNESSSYGNATMPAEFTFNRLGGNRATAYNWENNYSNAGHDYFYWNTADGLVGTAAGGTVRRHADPTFARGQAFMATVPMSGYVSADACNCDVGITSAARATRLATRFRVSRATKGSPFTLTPNASDAVVYQDEFVNWIETTYPGRATHPTAPVFYSLDNEPDLWHATHKEIFSDLNDNPATPWLQTYTGFTDTSVVYAKAIKAVSPNAMVFGPATATYTGITVLGRYPTPDPVYGTQNFTDVYLDRMRAASATAGRRLLDVYDVHFYPEAGTNAGTISNDYATQDAAMIEKRVQAPRSLWDPTYNDGSWVTNVTGGPIRLLPRLRAQIAAHYPGTKLAITEYYYGRGGDISGGIAQADVFGIFGREGVFAASLWPFAGVWAAPYNGDGNKAYAYIFGALRMYRNYDGAGGAFGDIGLLATTTDNAVSSVYASRNAAGNVVLIAINKTTTPKVAAITLRNVSGATAARTYVLSATYARPTRQADVPVANGALSYTMPAMSVTTLVLTP